MKKVIKKTKAKSKKERDDCFETSNIKFGKLDIVLQSYNTVPTIESFYNTIPEISTEKNVRSLRIFQTTHRYHYRNKKTAHISLFIESKINREC